MRELRELIGIGPVPAARRALGLDGLAPDEAAIAWEDLAAGN